MRKKENDSFNTEVENIKLRYARRQGLGKDNITDPHVISILFEKKRALRKLLEEQSINPAITRLLEIGCGNGSNLLQMVELGFNPSNLAGNELLPERIDAAKKLLPSRVKLFPGNALDLDLPESAFDVVYQSMVFSSILNVDFRQTLASKMWRMVKPGGGILWYDFIYDNPFNKDVNGIPLKEVKAMFPGPVLQCRKITLAPPLARFLTRIHPSLYKFFNILPFLRTHILCWIQK